MATLYCYKKLLKGTAIESKTIEAKETGKMYKVENGYIPFTYNTTIFKAVLPKVEIRFNEQIVIAEKALSIDELITIMLKEPMEKLEAAKHEIDEWNENIDNIVKCHFKTE